MRMLAGIVLGFMLGVQCWFLINEHHNVGKDRDALLWQNRKLQMRVDTLTSRTLRLSGFSIE
jgi:hypothetical protein